MTTLKKIVKIFNNGEDVVGATANYEYDATLSYSYLHILYESFDKKRTTLKIRKGFDWIYVHITYLRIMNKSEI